MSQSVPGQKQAKLLSSTGKTAQGASDKTWIDTAFLTIFHPITVINQFTVASCLLTAQRTWSLCRTGSQVERWRPWPLKMVGPSFCVSRWPIRSYQPALLVPDHGHQTFQHRFTFPQRWQAALRFFFAVLAFLFFSINNSSVFSHGSAVTR